MFPGWCIVAICRFSAPCRHSAPIACCPSISLSAGWTHTDDGRHKCHRGDVSCCERADYSAQRVHESAARTLESGGPRVEIHFLSRLPSRRLLPGPRTGRLTTRERTSLTNAMVRWPEPTRYQNYLSIRTFVKSAVHTLYSHDRKLQQRYAQRIVLNVFCETKSIGGTSSIVHTAQQHTLCTPLPFRETPPQTPLPRRLMPARHRRSENSCMGPPSSPSNSAFSRPSMCVCATDTSARRCARCARPQQRRLPARTPARVTAGRRPPRASAARRRARACARRAQTCRGRARYAPSHLTPRRAQGEGGKARGSAAHPRQKSGNSSGRP